MGNSLSLDKDDPFEDILVVIDEGDKSDETPDENVGGDDQDPTSVNLDPDQVSIKAVSDPEPIDDDPEHKPKSKTILKKKKKGIVHQVRTRSFSKKSSPSNLRQTRNHLEGLKIHESVNVEEIIRRRPIVQLGKKYVPNDDDDDGPPPPILKRYDADSSSSIANDQTRAKTSCSSNGNVNGNSAIESLISKSDNNKVKTSNGILIKNRRVCSFCSNTFNNLPALRKHLSRSHGEPLFKCTICKKAFNRKSNLRIHLRNHTGEKPFDCGYCLKKFSDPSSLYYHKKIHTESRSFKCSKCPKAFTQKGNLKTHIGTHVGRKPHVCKVCFRRYSNPRLCKRHEENHAKKK